MMRIVRVVNGIKIIRELAPVGSADRRAVRRQNLENALGPLPQKIPEQMRRNPLPRILPFQERLLRRRRRTK